MRLSDYGANAIARCDAVGTTQGIEQERSAAVQTALAELSQPLHEVVVLRHYEDMGFEEMARLLNTPASTLKSRFTVAMRQLHERLSTLGFGPEPTRENRA